MNSPSVCRDVAGSHPVTGAVLLGTEEDELVFFCWTVRGHGWFFLVKIVWPFSSPLDGEDRYYGRC